MIKLKTKIELPYQRRDAEAQNSTASENQDRTVVETVDCV